jgi:hypothetical protein
MSRDWNLNEEQLQELLLVRKVVISPLINEELETEDEASESAGSKSVTKTVEDSPNHKTQGKK